MIKIVRIVFIVPYSNLLNKQAIIDLDGLNNIITLTPTYKTIKKLVSIRITGPN